jgi:hypothetical protein
MDKTKKALLDDCREYLILAIGSAAGAGEHETAARINAILVELDIACEMCYTGKNTRKTRKNEEEKTMKTYYVYRARGFYNEFIIIFAETAAEKAAAAKYENECRSRGGNATFERITRKNAEKLLCEYGCGTIDECAENIRGRMPGLF